MVAEDDTSIQEFLRILLTREGFKVIVVGKGTEVIPGCHNFKPDLLLLDIMMPGMDGFEVCRKIRAESDLPIIILSARDRNVDKVLGLTLGCDDYITKPFESAELLLRIQAVIRRVKEHSDKDIDRNIVELPGLTINLINRETEVRGSVVDLTPKEFALLWLLANHQKQVYTRDQLLYQIWNSDYDGNPSVVTTLVKRLREKIESDVTDPFYIITVQGVGYKLGAKP
ncbi:MAG TPA: response regulator transcription factor [Desulfosporosinus sp.]